MLLRNEVLALVNLGTRSRTGKRMRTPMRCSDGMPVVVVDFEGRKIGLEVERIHGTREVVIKSLSRHYREVEGLIGASILGNGKIALIVDVETLISQHYHAAGTNGRIGRRVLSTSRPVKTHLRSPPGPSCWNRRSRFRKRRPRLPPCPLHLPRQSRPPLPRRTPEPSRTLASFQGRSSTARALPLRR